MRALWARAHVAKVLLVPERQAGEVLQGIALARLGPVDHLRSRDRRHSHRLDIGAPLISVDLQEHVTDAQRHALMMGDDDLDLRHAGHYRGDGHGRRRVYRVRRRG